MRTDIDTRCCSDVMKFVNMLGGLGAEITVGEGTGRAAVENKHSPDVESSPPPSCILRASHAHMYELSPFRKETSFRYVECSLF